MSSEHFYELYSQGLLDNGLYSEDFAEWAGHCKLKIRRANALEKLSRQRIEYLENLAGNDFIDVAPQEPVLELAR
ncbi:MAG TPA: hypothetical protein G4N94_14180 [Caldilineae bacterium]|nr:hypothetical protein [Caldilineae bacterium]